MNHCIILYPLPFFCFLKGVIGGRCFLCGFAFFFGLFGVDEVVEGEGGVVGHVTEGVGELFVVKGIDVANDVVGEADYLLDVLVEEQVGSVVGSVNNALQVDGGGIEYVGTEHYLGAGVGCFLSLFGGEGTVEVAHGDSLDSFMRGGEVGYLLHRLQGLDVIARADIAVVLPAEGFEAFHFSPPSMSSGLSWILPLTTNILCVC